MKKVRITGSTVVVRSSASKTAKKLGSVKKGKTFTYLATKKDAKGNKWYQIQYTSKTKGWVLGSLSEVMKAETKATTSAKKAAKQVEIIESPVRVRESPSITAKKVGSTSEGKKYKYLATKKDEKRLRRVFKKAAGDDDAPDARFSKRKNIRKPKPRMLMKELERKMGIEPTPSAWEAEVLPLNYSRKGQELLYTLCGELSRVFFNQKSQSSRLKQGLRFCLSE